MYSRTSDEAAKTQLHFFDACQENKWKAFNEAINKETPAKALEASPQC